MKKIIKLVLFLVALAFVFCLSFSCTAQQRLNRILTRHPELAKTDTVFVTKTIPGYNVDTTFSANKNTSKIDSIFTKYKTRIDTIILKELQTKIIKEYLKTPCLSQPINFNLPDGGKAILSQNNGQFKLQVVKQPTIIKTPLIKRNYTINHKYSGRMLAIGFLSGFFFACFVVVQYYKKGGRV